MIISARPYPSISKLFSKDDYFDLTHVEFYFLGREALLSSFIKLGAQPGDSIIIPAYMCDSSINPLQSYGFNLVFFDIEKDLSFSVNRLKKAIDGNQIKALLLVHYFGLTQNIDEVVGVCREHDIKVVEDASHSFMSQLLRNKNSIKGDIEIFSMRKGLPVLDGGALRINNDNYQSVTACSSQCVSKTRDVEYYILRLFEKLVTSIGFNIYGQFINSIKIKLRSKANNKIINFNAKACQASWQLRKYLGNKKYLQNNQKIIVNNFNQLSQALQLLGFRLFVESVEGNVVPQACILYDDKGGLVDYLRLKGVGAWRWPDEEMLEEVAQNPIQYPNTVFFDERIVLIPIHQSLDDKHINYIIQVLSRWQL